MLKGRSNPYRNLFQLSCTGIIILFTASCTIVKNYPDGKPFVYKTNIQVTGDFTNEEKTSLASKLKGQLDDSLKSRALSRLIYSVMKNPPAFATANADKSIIYMRALLASLGYFKDTITYTVRIDSAQKNQYRTTIDFDVRPGKVVRIDSFAYNIEKTELQQLAIGSQREAKIKKGDPFAKTAISDELDRLVTLYRNNGYMRFGREALIGIWDTLDISLLQPAFDPLEQLEQLQKLRQRRENPTANLEIRLRPGYDSSKLKKYIIGKITVYPDISLDTADIKPQMVTLPGNITVVSYKNLYKTKVFPPNIFLHSGQQYEQRNYSKTLNRFNSLNAWRLVNIEQNTRNNSDTADFIIRLTPSRKYSFVANLEGSNNNTVVSGNLFGIAINVGLQNRNFAHAANQSATNIRFGVETGRERSTDIKFIQTRQASINHTITFPRAIPSMKWLPDKISNNFRTVLALNGSLTERRDLYNLNNINLSWGYEFQWDKKFITLRFPNIEYASFKPQQRLLDIFNKNPALANIFADGFISSMQAGLRVTGGRHKHVNKFIFNTEVSGLISGLIRNNFLDTNLFRFIKADAEFTRKVSMNKSSLVLHAFAGIGYEFNSTVNEKRRYNLPLLRQYFVGGPNSMRAWGLRKLGPGSFIRDFDSTGLPDRYGDVHLEVNVEYRFPFIKAFGINIEGAIFTDIGNIWFMKNAPGRPPEEVFNLGRLGQDIAVGVGSGLRIDLSFFIIRLDYSFKAKDPSPSPANAYVQNKWFAYRRWGDAAQFQLAINYPFGF